MDKKKKKKLEAAGWTVGTVREMLHLNDTDYRMMLVKARLAKLVQDKRRERKMTQAMLAKKIGSSQPRIARIEKNDESVTIDLMLRAAIGLGVPDEAIGHAIAG